MKWLELIWRLFYNLFVVKKEKIQPTMSKLEEFILHLRILNWFDPYIPLTHAWHESAGLTKVIGNYNFWGIKKPQKWEGKTIDITTHEYINGNKVKVIDTFIDFNACSEALLWYENLIRRLYPESYNNKTDYVKYFTHLIDGKYKYATDPFYTNKLISLYLQLFGNTEIKELMKKYELV